MTKLPVLQARLKGLANAARNASCPESVELWEGRVSEIEFIADTTGKRAALAFAKSFYSGKSGFSTAHLIELNKRAKLCYRATRRRRSSSDSESSSSTDQHKTKHNKEEGNGKLRSTPHMGINHTNSECTQKMYTKEGVYYASNVAIMVT